MLPLNSGRSAIVYLREVNIPAIRRPGGLEIFVARGWRRKELLRGLRAVQRHDVDSLLPGAIGCVAGAGRQIGHQQLAPIGRYAHEIDPGGGGSLEDSGDISSFQVKRLDAHGEIVSVLNGGLIDQAAGEAQRAPRDRYGRMREGR